MSTDSCAFGKPANFSATSKQLVCVDPSDKAYAKVEELFQKGWKHREKEKPVIHTLYEVICSQRSLDSYAEHKFQYRKRANEQLLFHGTSQACSFGMSPSNMALCHIPSCSLCSIVWNSFDVQKCGTRHHFQRFGRGIYVTSCSSKADDYFLGNPSISHSRVLLVNRVIVGKAAKYRFNATTLIKPPRGYNSVIGIPGGDLSYEETVVYHNDAIRPAYVVIYGKAPTVIPSMEAMPATVMEGLSCIQNTMTSQSSETQCICNLGVNQAVLCDLKSCGICNVVKSSFKTFAFGEHANNGRFGEGVYSYRNPQLADKFATSCTSSPYRVTIACDVVVENMVEVPESESLFVATADAIIPAYVIMYSA
ncbi:ADP-ribosylation [Dendrothele bispora CBS 962.96]|uniref:Poly [ADP-ribose] polymerase n=1 Tax=Dendrothele bispora (strain CBS 962.96) TaxID=1314807 RepID=A0A4S8MFR6_DENBC|nr:ADP-ribosylation [Dendrothele bispora CBS 962.96]